MPGVEINPFQPISILSSLLRKPLLQKDMDFFTALAPSSIKLFLAF